MPACACEYRKNPFLLFLLFQNRGGKISEDLLPRGKELYKNIDNHGDIAELEGDDLLAVQKYMQFKDKINKESVNKKVKSPKDVENLEPIEEDGFIYDWWWDRERCKGLFKHKRINGWPPECGDCGKSSNKTNLKAITGPYQYYVSNSIPSFTPKLLAEEIMEDYDFKTISGKKYTTIYCYEEGFYKENGKNILELEAQNRLDHLSKDNKIRETKNYIERETVVDVQLFDQTSHIGVKNGLLNVENMDLVDEDASVLNTVSIPVTYDPEAECPQFLSFLDELIPEGDIPLFQEFLGCCLLKDYRFKKSLLMLGGGNNGKTTLLEFIRRYFLGNENVSTVELDELTGNRDNYAVYDLFGKLANFGSEAPTKGFSDTALFKKLTGNDTIRGRQIYEAAFEFNNFATMMFACNNLPETQDYTHAFWDRWDMIEFPNRFEKSDDNYKNQQEIWDEINDEEELSGILNWALEGLQRLLDHNPFSSSTTQEKIKEEWIKRSDPLQSFIHNFTEKEPNYYVTKDDFHVCYAEYAEGMDVTPNTKQWLGRHLTARIPGIRPGEVRINGKKTRVWKGLKLTDEYEIYNHHYELDEDGKPINIDKEAENKKDEGQAKLGSVGKTKDLSREDYFDKLCENGEMMQVAKRWLDKNTDLEGSISERLGDITDQQFTLLKREVRE